MADAAPGGLTVRHPSPHVRALRDQLWGLVQRRAVLRATDRLSTEVDRQIQTLLDNLRRQGVTPIEVQAELTEAEENAERLRHTLYPNPSQGTDMTAEEAELLEVFERIAFERGRQMALARNDQTNLYAEVSDLTSRLHAFAEEIERALLRGYEYGETLVKKDRR